MTAKAELNENDKSKAAGIGGGQSSGNVKVKITGGTIDASSYDGAAIGSGDSGDYNPESDWNVDISGNDTHVIAKSEWNGAGIGSGAEDMGTGKIKISNGTVIASGSSGIGTGDSSQGADTTIEISDGNIITSGGTGIGTGGTAHESKMDIEISGGNIQATGGFEAAGIGESSSARENVVNIKLTGGNITAIGGTHGASAIGGGVRQQNYEKSKITVKIGGPGSVLKLIAKSQGSNKGTIGEGIVDGDDPLSGVNFDDVENMTGETLGEECGILVELYHNYDPKTGTGTGTRYKVVHNKKYITETYADHPNDDHAWSNPTIIKVATPEEDGIIRYTCAVEGCPEKLDVSYKYVAPAEADDAQTMEVGVIFWDAANNAAAPDYLQGKTLNVEDTASAVSKAQADSVLADKEHWALAEDAGDLEIHPAADAAGTVYEQAVNASGCEYYVIANVTAQ